MASSIEVTGDSLVVAGAGPHPILASDLAQQGPTTTAGSTSLRAAIPRTTKTPRTGGARARLPQFCHSPGTRGRQPRDRADKAAIRAPGSDQCQSRFVIESLTQRDGRSPNPASVEGQTVVSGSRRGPADMARRSLSGRRPLGSAQVMHQLVPQRSTQLRRRAHAVHPRGGAARPETPVSCNSPIPLRSCPPRPAP